MISNLQILYGMACLKNKHEYIKSFSHGKNVS